MISDDITVLQTADVKAIYLEIAAYPSDATAVAADVKALSLETATYPSDQ